MGLSLLNDDCIHSILSMVGCKFSYGWSTTDEIVFTCIKDGPTRKRMEEYWRTTYLPSLYNDDGSVDDGVCASKIFHELLHVESKYYHSAGTAFDVGYLGIFGTFMNYIGEVNYEQDHDYAPAAVLGAVANGQVKMLEKLVSLGPDGFDFLYIATSLFDHSQHSIALDCYPECLDGHDTFLWLLYAAFDSRVMDVVVWLMRNGPYYACDVFWYVRKIWYAQVFHDSMRYRNPPIEEFYAMNDFKNKVDHWFRGWA